MCLVPRIYRGMAIIYDREPVLPQQPRVPIGIENDLEGYFGPPLEKLLSPQLHLQLQAMKTKQQEAQRRARESEAEEAFQECERELEDALKELGHIIRDKKEDDVRCSVFKVRRGMLSVVGPLEH
ncbi:hypothetical protein BC939DRAFT_494784 [Gamsiella multidivaricata]|uniref:uncharacterized protein n=1 Tax=Gamsiella multidivaricata TaxID=101098 RepID=UPI002220806A|nr:uncharacterized protein BC939DRAFT_494784 [Gamsiella multidivaricata]KAI7820147.1 hypothetical protein BC939DRAFT_494784 [Gamsiella multidivaricata]